MVPEHPRTSKRRTPERAMGPWLERADRAVYFFVALLFLVTAIAMGIYSVVTFVRHLNGDFRLDIIEVINDLLLVLIILEVLGTVRSYLATGTTSLRPFLYIGIISATRRILAIGAQTTLGEVANESVFRHLMIDLGVNGAVVLALGAALYLFGRQERGGEDAAERRREEEHGVSWD
jgi:uncharacterized membrane protein (DUF373 family)